MVADNKPNYKKRRKVTAIISLAILAIFYFISLAISPALFSTRGSSFTIRIISTLAILFSFYFIDHYFDLNFKPRHYIYIIIITISGIMLSPLYFIYPQFDKILHISLPFLLSSIIFHIVKPLNLNRNYKILLTFFIVLGFINLFEIGEYLFDVFLGFKLQGVFILNNGTYEVLQSKIDDTMIDMILGVSSSALYGLIILLFFRNKVR